MAGFLLRQRRLQLLVRIVSLEPLGTQLLRRRHQKRLPEMLGSQFPRQGEAGGGK